MIKNEKYLIGFDRFIDLNWLNHAYYLSKQRIGDPKKVENARQYLATYISGKDSLRKTTNLLSRIWLKDYSSLEALKKEALGFENLKKGELVILHFGMCLTIFPFFKEVLSQIGNLLFIQGFFYSTDIETRMMDKYSNISSVPRATQRIVQSINSWGLINKGDDKKYQTEEKNFLDNPEITSWILKAILLSSESKRYQLKEITSLNFLFPFRFDLRANKEIYLNSEMAIERDGMNNEYIILK